MRMQQVSAVISPEQSASPTSGASAVWDRLWRNEPSDIKDDDRLRREVQSPRWAYFQGRILDSFRSMRGLRAVELGAGRGDLSVLLARAGVRVTLLDRSDRALNLAKRRFGRLGLQADFEKADMLDSLDEWRGCFDISSSLGVIEHFRGVERDRALDAHRVVLRPGGLALLSVPHSFCLPYRIWKCYLELRGWWPYGMEIPYSKREMLSRARRVGFVGSETKCTGFFQALGGQVCGDLLKRKPAWADQQSRLDDWMGLNLLFTARRAD